MQHDNISDISMVIPYDVGDRKLHFDTTIKTYNDYGVKNC